MKRLPEETARRALPAPGTGEVERELEGIRLALGQRLDELDRRRHELTDWRLQLRRHPRIVAGAGLGALVVVGGLAAVVLMIARRREQPASRARELRLAIESFRSPRRTARPEPGVALKVLAAIATSVGSMMARKYLEALWKNPPRPAFGQGHAVAAEPVHSVH